VFACRIRQFIENLNTFYDSFFGTEESFSELPQQIADSI
jgi:hypothetical protein